PCRAEDPIAAASLSCGCRGCPRRRRARPRRRRGAAPTAPATSCLSKIIETSASDYADSWTYGATGWKKRRPADGDWDWSAPHAQKSSSWTLACRISTVMPLPGLYGPPLGGMPCCWLPSRGMDNRRIVDRHKKPASMRTSRSQSVRPNLPRFFREQPLRRGRRRLRRRRGVVVDRGLLRSPRPLPHHVRRDPAHLARRALDRPPCLTRKPAPQKVTRASG